MNTLKKMELIESYGYSIHDVKGTIYIVDPADNEDGFCLIGEDHHALLTETIEHLELI